MKLDRLETHDRLLEFEKQADYISQGCQNCINHRPKEFENYPFYIFAHKREIGIDERIGMFSADLILPQKDRKYRSIEDVPNAVIIWQPRLTKPSAQSNSMLFKAYPPGDNIRVIWMIPAEELWDQYTKGKISENQAVSESIHLFKTNKNKLEEKEIDDLPEEKIRQIYKMIRKSSKQLISEEWKAFS